jgi:hypothetical protein
MAYVVKVYDPLGKVPDAYRSARDTWVMWPDAAPLRLFATERAAREFIAIQGQFTGLEMCVENLKTPTQKVSSSEAPTLPLRRGKSPHAAA